MLRDVWTQALKIATVVDKAVLTLTKFEDPHHYKSEQKI